MRPVIDVFDFDQTATVEHTFPYSRIEQFLATADIAERLKRLEDMARGEQGASNMRPGFIDKALAGFTADTPVIGVATHHNNPFFQLLCMKYAIESRGGSFEFQRNDVEVVINPENEYTAVTLYKVTINGQEGTVAVSHIHTSEEKRFIFDNPGLELDGKNVQLQHLHKVLSEQKRLIPGDTVFNLYDDSDLNCASATVSPIVDKVFSVAVGGTDFTATPFVVAAEAKDVPAVPEPVAGVAPAPAAMPLPAEPDYEVLTVSESERLAKQVPGDVVIYCSATTGVTMGTQRLDNGGFLIRPITLDEWEFVRKVMPADVRQIATVNRVFTDLMAYASAPSRPELDRPTAEALARAYPGQMILRYSSGANGMVATYIDRSTEPSVMQHKELSSLICSDMRRFDSAGAVMEYLATELRQPVIQGVTELQLKTVIAYENISALMAGIGKDDAVIVAPCYLDQLIVRASSQAGAFAITVFASGGAEGVSVQHVLLSADNIQANIDRLQTAAGAKAFISEVCAGRTEFVTSAMAQAALNPDPAPVPAHTAAAGGMFAPAPAPAVATDPAAVAEDPTVPSQGSRQPTFH